MTKTNSENENQNWEDEIISFLSERKEKAFTSQEIMGGVNLHTEFSTPETAKMSTFAIADFTALLYDLVRKRKVKMKVIRGRMHFRAIGDITKCPKCGMEVSTPRKTWKMAGRPDKNGKRNELTIGLYDHCGKSFRKVLAKRKI
jgi:hypothetical protein